MVDSGPPLWPWSLGSPSLPPSPRRDVEPTVGPELQLPALVVVERLVITLTRIPSSCGVGDVRVATFDDEAGDARVAAAVDVIDVDEPVRAKARVERHREQPLLAAAADSPRDIQKRAPQQPTGPVDPDHAALLDHEQTRVTRRCGDSSTGLASPCKMRCTCTAAEAVGAKASTQAAAATAAPHAKRRRICADHRSSTPDSSRCSAGNWSWSLARRLREADAIDVASESRERDSNPRPFAYKAKALPAELSRRHADSTGLDLDSTLRR